MIMKMLDRRDLRDVRIEALLKEIGRLREVVRRDHHDVRVHAATIEECVQAAQEALLYAARSGFDHHATAREVFHALRGLKERQP